MSNVVVTVIPDCQAAGCPEKAARKVLIRDENDPQQDIFRDYCSFHVQSRRQAEGIVVYMEYLCWLQPKTQDASTISTTVL